MSEEQNEQEIELLGEKLKIVSGDTLVITDSLMRNQKWLNDLQLFRAQHRIFMGEWKYNHVLDCWFGPVSAEDLRKLREIASVKKV